MYQFRVLHASKGQGKTNQTRQVVPVKLWFHRFGSWCFRNTPTLGWSKVSPSAGKKALRAGLCARAGRGKRQSTKAPKPLRGTLKPQSRKAAMLQRNVYASLHIFHGVEPERCKAPKHRKASKRCKASKRHSEIIYRKGRADRSCFKKKF